MTAFTPRGSACLPIRTSEAAFTPVDRPGIDLRHESMAPSHPAPTLAVAQCTCDHVSGAKRLGDVATRSQSLDSTPRLDRSQAVPLNVNAPDRLHRPEPLDQAPLARSSRQPQQRLAHGPQVRFAPRNNKDRHAGQSRQLRYVHDVESRQRDALQQDELHVIRPAGFVHDAHQCAGRVRAVPTDFADQHPVQEKARIYGAHYRDVAPMRAIEGRVVEPDRVNM
jgi:hypothetical protein